MFDWVNFWLEEYIDWFRIFPLTLQISHFSSNSTTWVRVNILQNYQYIYRYRRYNVNVIVAEIICWDGLGSVVERWWKLDGLGPSCSNNSHLLYSNTNYEVLKKENNMQIDLTKAMSETVQWTIRRCFRGSGSLVSFDRNFSLSLRRHVSRQARRQAGRRQYINRLRSHLDWKYIQAVMLHFKLFIQSASYFRLHSKINLALHYKSSVQYMQHVRRYPQPLDVLMSIFLFYDGIVWSNPNWEREVKMPPKRWESVEASD